MSRLARLTRPRSHFGGGLPAAVAIGLCAACSTPTTSTDVWKSPGYEARMVRNVIVFGGGLTETDRHTVEDGFANALSSRGVRAVASYAVFPGPVPTQQTAQHGIQSGGYDGVLVSTMRGATGTYVKFETTLWDPHGGGRMIFSDVTQTENPSSAENFIQSLVDSVVPEMEKAGLLPKAQAGHPVSSYAAPRAHPQ